MRAAVTASLLGCVAATLMLQASLPAQGAEHAPLGRSKAHPIEVCKPRGQAEYLARLVCPTGEHPTFERNGSAGLRNEPSPDLSEDAFEAMLLAQMRGQRPASSATDYHIVDSYTVACEAEQVTLYLDMYHCEAGRPGLAPPGFSLLD